MPITFDFSAVTPPASASLSAGPLTFIAGGVNFSLSTAVSAAGIMGEVGGTTVGSNHLTVFDTPGFPRLATLSWSSTGGFTGLSGPVTVDFGVNSGVAAFFLTTGGGSGAVVDGVPITPGGLINGIRFQISGSGLLQIISITADRVACYCAGTRIATPDGGRAVEDLAEGDLVLTADGRAELVRWVGRQEVDPRFADTTRVSPIRMSAGALGSNLPERDLWLSPDHAVAMDGVLYEARALVNGTTVVQVPAPEPFPYFHIETEAHELLLAEGVPAESFLDYAGRDGFGSGADRTPRDIPELDLPRVCDRARLVA